jgi:hypothetical protein
MNCSNLVESVASDSFIIAPSLASSLADESSILLLSVACESPILASSLECESSILASSLACESSSPPNLVLMSRLKVARFLSVAC